MGRASIAGMRDRKQGREMIIGGDPILILFYSENLRGLDYVHELAYGVISSYVTPRNSIVHGKTLKRSKKLIHNSLRNSSLTRYD